MPLLGMGYFMREDTEDLVRMRRQVDELFGDQNAAIRQRPGIGPNGAAAAFDIELVLAAGSAEINPDLGESKFNLFRAICLQTGIR